MDQSPAFTDALFQAIMERQQYFDLFLLPKLQEEYRIAQGAAKTVRTVLVKKGILRDNPYKYDSKVETIELPPDENFTESERQAVIGERMAQYEAMLDYVNNYFTFSCDFLTTERINKLASLNRTFYWEAFSHTSNRPNTRGLAELINTLRTGADPLSTSIISDALTQLSKTSIGITKTLKGLSDFHRERYKVAVRKLVMPGAVFNPDLVNSGGMGIVIKEIKKAFAASMRDQPFYTELIEEILREDFSPDHAVLQQDLIQKLAVNKTDPKKNVSAESLKPVLMDGVRTIGATASQLGTIASKIADNKHTLDSLEKSFFERLSELFRKAFNLPQEEEEVTITTIDPVTQAGKRESIKISTFVEDLNKRSRIYTAYSIKTSPAHQKIEAMDEPQILDMLTRTIAELHTILKQSAGLDDYFKSTAPSSERERIRGIKVEISAVRNSIVKANQCRAEYAAQLEEQQQLKKLGILDA